MLNSGADIYGNAGYVGVNGKGVVTVTGPGSQWNSSGALMIASGGQGSLFVANGGRITDSSATVGSGVGSSGSVLVDAAKWINTGTLTIGVNGTGTVSLENGASLAAGNTTIGAQGSLIVDPSIVTVLGSFTLLPDGTLSLAVAGPSPDLLSQVNISGVGLFHGTVDFDFIDGFAPTAGESFDLIHALSADFNGVRFQIEGLEPGFAYGYEFANGTFRLDALNNGTSTSSSPEPNTLSLLSGAVVVFLIGALCRTRRDKSSRGRLLT